MTKPKDSTFLADLIAQARTDADAALVLADLAEETGLRLGRVRIKRSRSRSRSGSGSGSRSRSWE